MNQDIESVVIVNPTKLDDPWHARELLAGAAAASGVAPPRWIETTAEDPGTGQAKQAVAAGADVVLAWGGDGTVTAIAAGLMNSGVPLAIIPSGTGNLLARNIDVPLDPGAAAKVAFNGANRGIDMLEIGLGGSVVFGTVMAGIGIDASIIDAPAALKKTFGPAAYVVNSVTALGKQRMRVAVSVDDGPHHWMDARSVLVANVGGLIGGLDLAPDAAADDGLLHVLVLRLGGPTQWVRTGAALLTRRGTGDIHLTGQRVRIVSSSHSKRQVDGDVVGDGRRLEVRVRPRALLVKVPHPGSA